ncbi:unnamed protein product, partial [Hapterophycus canaliculatus]
MRHQVSGIIADLLRNKRSIPYARAWRSDLNMLTITQLMVRLWVAEESRLGVSRPNGVLQNLWEPLQSHDREHRRTPEHAPGWSARSRPSSRGQAGADPKASRTSGGDTLTAEAMTNLDMRGKIAAVLGMVGFNGSTTDGLGPSDLKASYMATSYMSFRAGEAWQRVRFSTRTASV